MDSIKELKAFLKALPKLNDKDRETRVQRAKEDFRYFVQTYLGHHIGLDSAISHKETSLFRNWVYKELPQMLANKGKADKESTYYAREKRCSLDDTCKITHNKILIKAYRGAAKTTLVSRLFCLWKVI